MTALLPSSPIIIIALTVLDVLVCIPLVLELLGSRARRVNAKNLAEAFKGLEAALERAVPDLPVGFTWGDALARLRSAGVQTNGMEDALKGYESYRYGRAPLPNMDFHEVVAVANMLGGINTRKSETSNLGQ